MMFGCFTFDGETSRVFEVVYMFFGLDLSR